MSENNAENITTIWTYNLALFQDEPYILLGHRKGFEDNFWHLPCGGAADLSPSNEAFINIAKTAIQQEAGLAPDNAKFGVLYHDQSLDSSWQENVTCAHICADHGRCSTLPAVTAQTHDFQGRERGLVEAEWVKLADIQTSTPPQTGIDPAASAFVSFKGLPLRSTVAHILSQEIIPYLCLAYGPFRKDAESSEKASPATLQR